MMIAEIIQKLRSLAIQSPRARSADEVLLAKRVIGKYLLDFKNSFTVMLPR